MVVKNQFKENVVRSFKKVRENTDNLQRELTLSKRHHEQFQQSTAEWIEYLVKENNQLKERLAKLERQEELKLMY